MSDLTKCAKCGRPANAPIHFIRGGHLFERIEAVPYQPEEGYGVWIFLAVTLLVAIITVIVLG